jgi:hypothetical protein
MNRPSKSRASRYELLLRHINDAFRPTLGDDEIRAAAVVVSGPSPYLMIWLTTAAAVAQAAWEAV